MPLGTGDTGQGQRQLHVSEHALVCDEVVALKNEADPVIAVRVPVVVGIGGSVNVVDDDGATVVMIQAADNVE